MGKNGVSGIIVPLDGQTIDRVFHHRPIIPLFVGGFPSDLQVGDRTFLYEKGGGRVLQGEGAIVGIEYQGAGEVRGYGQRLCLSGSELDEYIRSSGKTAEDKMLVLRLEDHPVKYVRPLRCSVKVEAGGKYMTAEVYSKILSENA